MSRTYDRTPPASARVITEERSRRTRRTIADRAGLRSFNMLFGRRSDKKNGGSTPPAALLAMLAALGHGGLPGVQVIEMEVEPDDFPYEDGVRIIHPKTMECIRSGTGAAAGLSPLQRQMAWLMYTEDGVKSDLNKLANAAAQLSPVSLPAFERAFPEAVEIAKLISSDEQCTAWTRLLRDIDRKTREEHGLPPSNYRLRGDGEGSANRG